MTSKFCECYNCRMKRYLPFFLLTTLTVSMCAAQGSSGKALTAEQDLKLQLAGKVLKLRVPEPGSKLNFDSAGRLTSKPEPGIRGVDDEFQISSVKVRNNVLVLRGDRLVELYDPAKDSIILARLALPVTITIGLSERNPTTQDATAALATIFMAGSGANGATCSDFKFLDKFLEPQSTKAEVEKQREIRRPVCFPSGAEAYTVSKDVVPPKAMLAPGPHYPNSELHAGTTGTVKVAVRVGRLGRITDVILLNRGTVAYSRHSLSVLREWRFKPAHLKTDSNPLPAAIKIEINFRRD